MPHLVAIDRNARYPWAMMMADKTDSDGRAVKGLVQFLVSLGHRDVVLMCDGEPAAAALRARVRDARSCRTLCRSPALFIRE